MNHAEDQNDRYHNGPARLVTCVAKARYFAKRERLMGHPIVNKDVQCDEICAHVGKKEAHKLAAEENDDGTGETYASWRWSGMRNSFLTSPPAGATEPQWNTFIEGVRAATANRRFQISTDASQPYLSNQTTLSDRYDFAQVIEVSSGAAQFAVDQPAFRSLRRAQFSLLQRVDDA